MVSDHWHLNHSLLSPALNLGLLHPREVVDRVEAAYRERGAPISSVEGFVRQVIGWREYVWGLYWRHMPDYRDDNHLGNDRPLPPVFTGDATTEMNCLRHVLGWVHDHAYTHHIPRLMVVANVATLAGVRPTELVEWMWRSYVDGAEWVMVPNVVGMGKVRRRRADEHQAVRGGNYISTMTDLLRVLPVLAGPAHRRRRVPVHDAVLGLPGTPRGPAARQPRAGPRLQHAGSALRPHGRARSGA